MKGLRFGCKVSSIQDMSPCCIIRAPTISRSSCGRHGACQTRVEDVCFTELVDKIDELVERTDNYDADIEVWMNTPESDPDKQAAKDLGKLVCELQELGIGGDIIIID